MDTIEVKGLGSISDVKATSKSIGNEVYCNGEFMAGEPPDLPFQITLNFDYLTGRRIARAGTKVKFYFRAEFCD